MSERYRFGLEAADPLTSASVLRELTGAGSIGGVEITRWYTEDKVGRKAAGELLGFFSQIDPNAVLNLFAAVLTFLASLPADPGPTSTTAAKPTRAEFFRVTVKRDSDGTTRKYELSTNSERSLQNAIKSFKKDFGLRG